MRFSDRKGKVVFDRSWTKRETIGQECSSRTGRETDNKKEEGNGKMKRSKVRRTSDEEERKGKRLRDGNKKAEIQSSGGEKAVENKM